MTKNISKITVLGLFAAALVALPALSHAANPIAPASPDQPAPAKPDKPNKHGTPFHGKLAAVDVKAMSLTVGTLTIQVTSDTKITKDGQPAALADGVVGEPVGGAYNKTDDGKLTAISIHFGAKSGPKRNSEASDKK